MYWSGAKQMKTLFQPLASGQSAFFGLLQARMPWRVPTLAVRLLQTGVCQCSQLPSDNQITHVFSIICWIRPHNNWETHQSLPWIVVITWSYIRGLYFLFLILRPFGPATNLLKILNSIIKVKNQVSQRYTMSVLKISWFEPQSKRSNRIKDPN